MDERDLSAADAAYAAGEWRQAADGFLAAAEGDEHPGYALHQAGNALMRLRELDDAVDAYRRSAADDAYERRGAVLSNLGAALATLGRNDEAIEAFDGALADADYATPYKALLGRAAALYSLGRYEEAANEYRQAAWADGNPDPGKALNNLGLSFIALGKPQDAVEAFKAALGLDGYAAKGKAAVNLALAYDAMGFFEEAVRSFEAARDTYGYELTGDVLALYEKAKGAASAEGAQPDGIAPAGELVEGWETGDLAAALQTGSPELPDVDDDATARFFNMTEAEMKDADRAARKAERAAKRTPKTVALRVVAALVIVIVVAGGVAGALYMGYGYPTQEMAVNGLMKAYSTGQPYTDFWVAVPPTDIKQEMRALPAKFTSYRINGIDRASRASTAVVQVTLDSGSTLAYDVVLAREGVGWKVVGVKNRWSSTEQ